MTSMSLTSPAAMASELAWRRERLLAGARPRRRSLPSLSLRQRAGLAVIRLGLAVAGGLSVASMTDPAGLAPQP